jgi:callose synthase
VLTILTVYVVVYLMTVLAIFDLEKIGDRLITPMGTVQMLLGGLGLLQTIPLFATLGVERGWWASIQEIFLVFITGGPLHFMFHIQTKANYMSQTIIVGGAKYRPTGRGFVTQHTPLDENFRMFASSHLYLGFELAACLILMGVYTDAGQYIGRTWSLWLASASFLCSPFWFNPLTFDWNVVTNDYDVWLKWIHGTSGGSSKSWSMWYNEENVFYRSMPVLSKVVYLVKASVYLLIAEGIRRSELFKLDISLNKPIIHIGTVIFFIGFLLVLGRIFTASEKKLPYPVRRTIGIVLFLGIVAGVLTLFIEDSNYIRYTLAAYYAVAAVNLVGLILGLKFVKQLYLVHDFLCGHVFFVVLFILAALQLPGLIQTWLLYHNALSSDVVVSDILRYARRSQESGSSTNENHDDLAEQIAELKRIVQRQEQILLGSGISHGSKLVSSGSTGSFVDHFSSIPAAQVPTSISNNDNNSGMSRGRAVSMSGIDVWGHMALGDVQPEQLGQPGAQIAPVQTHHRVSSDGFSFTQPDILPPR